MQSLARALSGLAVLASLACGGTHATHPALRDAELPEIVSLQRLFADQRTTWAYQISPDGQRLAWMGVPSTQPALHWKRLGEPEVHVVEWSRARAPRPRRGRRGGRGYEPRRL